MNRKISPTRTSKIVVDNITELAKKKNNKCEILSFNKA